MAAVKGGVPYCGDPFCKGEKPYVDARCHDLEKEAGKKILWQRSGGTCYCICSCLGTGTKVTLENGSTMPVQELVQGQTKVIAAGLNLHFTGHVVGQTSFAPPAQTENTIYLQYTIDGQRVSLVVTQSHPFLLHKDRRIVGAGRLAPDDRLVDRHGNPVQIEAIAWGRYTGSFWEFATNMNPPDPNLTGHLVVTGGVVTGDFAVETFLNYPTGEATPLGDLLRTSGPIVGSPEWVAAHGEAKVHAAIDVNGFAFTPAAANRVAVPANASDFLPAWQAEWLKWVAPKLPYNDPYALELCEWLLDRVYRPLYPEVEFLFDWYSEEVNSHSWVDGKKKFVYLSGGLARIEGFDYDGVALALAHEVGHLYGKPDGSPSGVTCEGEADYYGAAIVLRKVWFGTFYFEGLQRAIDQVKVLYSYLLLKSTKGEQFDVKTPRKDKAGRGYPDNACRISTWEAAMSTPHKPACADCEPITA